MQVHRFIDPAVAAAEPAHNALYAMVPRNKAGWLELVIVLGCDETGDDYLHSPVRMIQRTPDAEFEFHS